MSVINSIPLIAAGDDGYQISRSVRLRSSASAYFNRTPASITNRTTWTFSTWLKRGALGIESELLNCFYATDNKTAYLRWNSDNTLTYFDYNATGGVFINQITTTQVFRDPSAWYHIVLTYDTGNATSSDRLRLYVNGQRVTSLSIASYPTLNYAGTINTNASTTIGRFSNSATGYFDGYLTEINFIDGQALTPSSFGETDTITGVWKPKKYAGTYGSNGFFLNFSDPSAATAAAIGKDNSGNGNNWTPNNISVTAGVTYDSMLDVPTMWADGGNGRGNYCTWNPLDKVNGTLRDANLSSATNNQNYGVRGTIAFNSGKHYWEFTVNTASPTNHHGVWDVTEVMGSNYVGQTVGSWGMYDANGNKRNNGSYTAYGSGFTTNDIGMVAVDMDSGKIWWGKNGTWFASGAPASGTNEAFSNLSGRTVSPAQLQQSDCSYNFGQRPFAYTPPSGFLALNTQNLPDSTIKAGNKFFDVSTWTGNGTSPRTISGLSFQPDLVWIKGRSIATSHLVNDAVRGANLGLFTNLTNAEAANNAGGYLSAFTSSGFSVTAGSVDFNIANTNGESYVGWQWKESASAGFDIVTYTGNGTGGRTVSHGLGVAPAMIIVKNRSVSGRNWPVYHKNMAASPTTGTVWLNVTNAFQTTVPMWSAAPTSSVFSVTADNDVNANTENYVAYLFAEVAGFSKFGSYTGNGSADGPFVYCGFRPKFVMIKRTDSATYGNWEIIDTARDTYNQAYLDLSANLSAAENATDGAAWDILANGFKCRDGSSTGNKNVSGATYIFAAFAETAFKFSLGR